MRRSRAPRPAARRPSATPPRRVEADPPDHLRHRCQPQRAKHQQQHPRRSQQPRPPPPLRPQRDRHLQPPRRPSNAARLHRGPGPPQVPGEEARQHLHDPAARRAAVAPEVDRRLTAGLALACAMPVQPPPTVATRRRPVRLRIAEPPRMLLAVVDIGDDHRAPLHARRVAMLEVHRHLRWVRVAGLSRRLFVCQKSRCPPDPTAFATSSLWCRPPSVI